MGVARFGQVYGSILAPDRRSVPTRREAQRDYERALWTRIAVLTICQLP